MINTPQKHRDVQKKNRKRQQEGESLFIDLESSILRTPAAPDLVAITHGQPRNLRHGQKKKKKVSEKNSTLSLKEDFHFLKRPRCHCFHHLTLTQGE